MLTDNRALTSFQNLPSSKRMWRWRERLADFDLDVKYMEGIDNGAADAMSRVGLAGQLAKTLSGLKRETGQQAEDASDGDCEDMDGLESAPTVSAVTRAARAAQAGVDVGNKETSEPTAPVKPSGKKVAQRQPRPKRLSKDELRNLRVKIDRLPETWQKPSDDLLGVSPDFHDGLLKQIAAGYSSDAFFAKLYQPETNASESDHTKVPRYTDFYQLETDLLSGGKVTLLYHARQKSLRLCLPSGVCQSRSIREIFLEHAHTTIGHFGAEKTLAFVVQRYWWPSVAKDVKAYCDTCLPCQACKPSGGKPEGFVHSLPVSAGPWHTVGIDLVGPLPKSSYGSILCDNLLVVVDHFSGEVELCPTQMRITGKGVADIWLQRIYPHHGLPGNIVSDRDVRFTGEFWQSLHSNLGTTLSMSSSYHCCTPCGSGS